MNDLSIKPNNIIDVQAGSSSPREKTAKAAALAALAGTFKDLVHQVGSNADTGLSSIAERRGITAVSEPREPAEQYDDAHGGQHDDHDVQRAQRGRDDDHGDNRGETARNDHGENEPHETREAPRDDAGAGRQSRDGADRDDSYTDKSAHSDRPAADDRRGSDQAGTGDDAGTETADAAPNENGGQGNANTNSDNGKNGPEVADVATAAAQAMQADAGLNPAQMLAQAGVNALREDGQASETAKSNPMSAIAAAANGAAKESGVHSTANAGKNATGTQAQVQANSGGQANGQAETATKGQSNIQQQAQQMARALGNDVRMQVNVNVANEAETLTSRPTATLAAGASLAPEAKGQAQGSQQAGTHAAQAGPAQAALASAGQPQGGQAQGQNAQANAQNGQAQMLAQAGGEAKGPAAASNATHAGGASTGASAGTEGSSTSGNVTGSGQAQQAQQNHQAQQAQHAAQARGQQGPSPAEQVSVRITRALQAGNDKISIRLNPAELGRVEVKVELAHDGRMTAVVTADNKDTLDLLRRDASELQKALQEGGIDLDSGNLAFNLRGEDGQNADQGDGNAGLPGDAADAADMVEPEPELILTPQDIVLGDGRIDVKA